MKIITNKKKALTETKVLIETKSDKRNIRNLTKAEVAAVAGSSVQSPAW